ncbi:MAG: amidohydrolase [Tannerellaceae bacterium]|jgi:aminobenzoyl-glutamate utilization protein B|nr:amidohydrolase [Tannerellaceae bacterium]
MKTKKILLLMLCMSTISYCTHAQKKRGKDPLRNVSVEYLNDSFAVYDKLQKQIWSHPELGFLEVESSAFLKGHLRENGFTVEAGIAGMPTAFVATYGSGSPVIGILAEFDALPGLSQDTVPYRKPLTEGGNGHACGHNVFGVGSVAGAVAISRWLDGREGTVKVFGTPAEEGGGGKVYMVREGFFKGVDVVLDWHPSTDNSVSVGTGTAIQMIDYTFRGIAAHAAGSPDKGRSALDGVEAFNYMVNLLREHVPASSRIHYVIVNGGEAPNVVPDYAKVSYYIRSPQREILKALTEWIGQAAEGAAKGTQTTVTSEVISGFYEKLYNRNLAELVQRQLHLVGGIRYDERERTFAGEIVKGLNYDPAILRQAEEVKPLAEEKPSTGGASSDVGDVSWNVPTVSFGTAAFVPGSAGHSWQNVASGGSTIGTKGLINAAKVFSLTAIELYTNPQLIREATKEFEEKRGKDFRYAPLLGNRPPALDYRLKR